MKFFFLCGNYFVVALSMQSVRNSLLQADE